MSWIMAATAAASSLLGSSQKDNSWKQSARSAGRSRAQVAASKGRALGLLGAKVRAVDEGALLQGVAVQQDEAAAVADATVQAAASGSVGGNVDQTIEQSKTTADVVRENLERQRRSQLLQVNQDYEDITWEAENNTYEVHTQGGGSGSRNLAAAAIAGVGAYFGS